MPLAVIGGTGVYQLAGAEGARPARIVTQYGEALARQGEASGREVFFVARHGADHSIPPHRVNYRANIAALKTLGCTAILATNAVGSLRTDLPPGTFVAADQFLDFTKSRPLTFYDGDDEHGVKHVDVTEPYCANVRRWLIEGASDAGERCVARGTYLCAEGPRFETAAEIRLFAQWGADMVGMTGVPEVVLAREAVTRWVTDHTEVKPPTGEPAFAPDRAVFVTLRMDGRLRGCIGTLEPVSPLGEAVIESAISAATHDPRFRPVAAGEIPALDIHLSILSPMRTVSGPDEIVIGKHGIVVRQGMRSGVFLPEVATEQGWDLETTLSILCTEKAGLPADAWKHGAELRVFTTQSFGEEDYGLGPHTRH